MDDDKNYLKSLELLLLNQNFRVVTSVPIENPISLINDIKPDLIILDYLMGSVYGGQICSELKENPSTKHIPVIVLTAYDKVFKALGDYGCDSFLSKTQDSAVLIKEINQLIKK